MNEIDVALKPIYSRSYLISTDAYRSYKCIQNINKPNPKIQKADTSGCYKSTDKIAVQLISTIHQLPNSPFLSVLTSGFSPISPDLFPTDRGSTLPKIASKNPISVDPFPLVVCCLHAPQKKIQKPRKSTKKWGAQRCEVFVCFSPKIVLFFHYFFSTAVPTLVRAFLHRADLFGVRWLESADFVLSSMCREFNFSSFATPSLVVRFPCTGL